MMKLIFNINYYYLKHKLQDFANGSADNIKFSKPKQSNIAHLGGVLRDIPILSNLAKRGKDIARDLEKYFLDKGTDKFNKKYITVIKSL